MTYCSKCGDVLSSENVPIAPIGHNYLTGFVWQSNFSAATVTAICGNCDDTLVMPCTVAGNWDPATAKLTFIATEEVDGKIVSDEQFIQLIRSGNKLTVTNSAAQAADKVNMILMIAGYNGGQMTGCQMVMDVTGVTEIDLAVSGTLKVFFLKPGTYAPLFLNAELQ